jgi:hypothetical protein
MLVAERDRWKAFCSLSTVDEGILVWGGVRDQAPFFRGKPAHKHTNTLHTKKRVKAFFKEEWWVVICERVCEKKF